MFSRSWLAIVSFLFACGGFAVNGAAAEPLAQRWLYLQQNLQVTENMPKLEALLRRAAKAGYNGVVLADYKLNVLNRVPQHYFQNAEQFKAFCKELDLEIIPTVMPFGYSDGIFAHDPNLAEGLPVKNAPFIARGMSAALDGGGHNLVLGAFEERKEDTFVGWNYQDEPGNGTFADTQVKHGGKTSLRIDNSAGVTGNRRVNKKLKVRPWSQFHASVWVRSQDFESASSVRMFAMNAAGRVLSHTNLGVKRNQDWTEHHIVFNSLDGDEVLFYLGVWGCRGGKLWLDDVRVVEEPFVNLVRRPGCPLVVQDESGATTYEEGRDFAELRDEKMATVPWAGNFDTYHTPPTLKLLAGSRIRDGQKLRVSFFHAVTIYDHQVPCSLSEPKVFKVVEDQVRRVEKLFASKTYFLSHDEIRVANWSQQDQTAGKTAGELLAENVRHCAAIIRKINPQSRLCIWSDMFDPHHNAVKDFYLVNGDLAGSWEGLPKDTIIVNWNSGKPDKSLPFFAGRGHSQILAGYYDGPPQSIRTWLAAGKDLPGIRGAMYTTWESKFDDLEKFAEFAWGSK